MSSLLRRAAAVLSGLLVLLFVTAAGASAAGRPGFTSVTISGTAGPGQSSPTITINGSGFGRQPAGTSDNVTSCGTYTANGNVYRGALYFVDNRKFEAGYSNNSGADCIGIIVVSWSPTQIVLRFGNAYGSFTNWFLTNGDGYALSVKTAMWGGTVTGLT